MDDLGPSVLQSFMPILSLSSKDLSKIGVEVPIPQFPPATITNLCQKALNVLVKTKPLVATFGTPVIVGDIHGNFVDLVRILVNNGLPPTTDYIFLGDYVDRGEFSLEVIVLLLALYTAYPDHIILIRGNHEFSELNRVYGFLDSIIHQYNSQTLWYEINNVFNYLPLVAILNRTIMLVHGGISRDIVKLSEIGSLSYPIEDYMNPLIKDIVWSDPTDHPSEDGGLSLRGIGHRFGYNTFSYVSYHLGIEKLIRAHQSVDGVEAKWDGKLYTVFSSSSYYANTPNHAGVLKVGSDGTISSTIYPPIEKNSRSKCYFKSALQCERRSKTHSQPRFAKAILDNAILRASKTIKKKTISPNLTLGKSSTLKRPSTLRKIVLP